MATAGWNPEVQPGGAAHRRKMGFNWRTQAEIDHLTPEERTLHIERYALPNRDAQRVLERSAISLEEAYKRGLRSSIYFWDDAVWKPFKAKGVPEAHSAGLIIPHYALNGSLSLQYRPDEAYLLDWQNSADDKPRKYDWEAGAGNGVSIGYNAALRLDGTDQRLRLIIVEGTRQAIAADIYAAGDCIVVGIPGIWNGQSERVLHADILNLILRGYIIEIIIIPDGDFKTKPHVWSGAALLAELITEASGKAVRFASLEEPEGLDDYLGSHPGEKRAGLLAALIDAAGDLPPRPTTNSAQSDTVAFTENEWSRFNANVSVTDLIDILALGADLVEDEDGRLYVETAAGEASIGRFSDGTEYVYAADQAVAAYLGVQQNKAAPSSKLLTAAITGKAAYRVVKHFDGKYDDAIQFLRSRGGDLDDLRTAAMALNVSKRKTRTLDPFTEAASRLNAQYTATSLAEAIHGTNGTHKAPAIPSSATASDYLLALLEGDRNRTISTIERLIAS